MDRKGKGFLSGFVVASLCFFFYIILSPRESLNPPIVSCPSYDLNEFRMTYKDRLTPRLPVKPIENKMKPIAFPQSKSEVKLCPADPYDVLAPSTDVRTRGFLAASNLRYCYENPFTKFLYDSNGVPTEQYWRSEMMVESFLRNICFASMCLTKPTVKWGVYDAFQETIDCPTLQRYPAIEKDGTKFLCELDQLEEPCVIYSLGSNGNYEFEEEMMRTTKCHMFTFDCTSKLRNKERITSFGYCLGPKDELIDGRQYRTLPSIINELGHKFINIFKMDIEGYETVVFQNWVPTDNLPHQIVFEIHHKQENIMMLNNLYHLGYRLIARDDNPKYNQGSEFTLLRVMC